MRKIIFAVAVVAMIAIAGCTQKVPEIEIKNESPVGNFSSVPEQTLIAEEIQNETVNEIDKTAEWCVPTKINFLADPYVSVHSPKLIYIENYVTSKTPVLTTLVYDDAYKLPLTGNFVVLTDLGIPRQNRVTDLTLQLRLTHSDGDVFYSEPFHIDEADFSLDSTTVYHSRDSFNVLADGTTSIDSKVEYSINGVKQVQCTPKNVIPFSSSDDYSLPSIGNIIVGNLTEDSTHGSQINAKSLMTFNYGGFEPSLVELQAISAFNPNNKVYLTADNPKCVDGVCSAEAVGFIGNEQKQIFCNSAFISLLVRTGGSNKNILLDIDTDRFLKEFGGC